MKLVAEKLRGKNLFDFLKIEPADEYLIEALCKRMTERNSKTFLDFQQEPLKEQHSKF